MVDLLGEVGSPWDFSDSQEAKFPFPFFEFDSWGFWAWTLDWDLASGLFILKVDGSALKMFWKL